MTTLFSYIQPANKFRVSVYEIARCLNIPVDQIVRVELWSYVIFVHRRDCGGQFISYRKLQQWRNAVACQIQKCQTLSEMLKLLLEIIRDWSKHNKQYDAQYRQFVQQVWDKRWANLCYKQELEEQGRMKNDSYQNQFA